MDKTETVIIAGDDDQAIFQWSGADTDHFINLSGKVQVLDVSYRVPRKIQGLATGLTSQISRRRPKTWKARQSEGDIQWHNMVDTVPLETGEWLLLARNGYMLKQYEDHCMSAGFSFEGKRSPLRSPALTAIRYWERLRSGGALTPDQVKKFNGYMSPDVRITMTRNLADYQSLDMNLLQSKFGLRTTEIWHIALGKISPVEREYFIAARKRGETLVYKPRIRISTIHGVKGGEADNVCLMTDIAPRTFDEMNKDLDSELRVFYVGVTRAKQSLHLLNPQTNMSFNI
jgi:hypothetical protein